MSYSSLSKLDKKTKIKDVLEVIKLLGYQYTGILDGKEAGLGKLKTYYWFDEKNYKSWIGIELSIYKIKNILHVETSTPIGRSYYDLEHQNNTIKLLKQLFGGTFTTDEGKNRFLFAASNPPSPNQSGCHLAFNRFGFNLIIASLYFKNREFKTYKPETSGLEILDKTNPWIISNNLLLPFLVAIFEDYWKSTYIALLQDSDKKEGILKTKQLPHEKLIQISNGTLTIEQAFAEQISFQNISMICKHFDAIDSKLNFASILRKPYKRRKTSLFESLEKMTKMRHALIHRGTINEEITSEEVKILLNNLMVSTEKCYRHLTKTYGWTFNKSWHINL